MDHKGSNDKRGTATTCRIGYCNSQACRRFIGNVLCFPTSRPVSLAINWATEGGSKRKGGPNEDTQDTLKEYLQAMGVTGTLPAIVPDRDNSSLNIPRGKAGTKYKDVILS